MTMMRIVFLQEESFRINGVVQKMDFDDNDDDEEKENEDIGPDKQIKNSIKLRLFSYCSKELSHRDYMLPCCYILWFQ